jgi:hypothetical protein
MAVSLDLLLTQEALKADLQWINPLSAIELVVARLSASFAVYLCWRQVLSFARTMCEVFGFLPLAATLPL